MDGCGRLPALPGCTCTWRTRARTPQVMNAEFARRGLDAVAVSADVAPAGLGGFARGLRG